MNLKISPKGRCIAIGDIHGHSHLLNILLNGINPKEDDTFIFLGDMVNRGPDSKGVIDRILDLSNICKVHCVCGNHEEMILAAKYGGKSEINFWLKFGGIETLASFGIKNIDQMPGKYMLFVADCLDFIESDTHIFVHASYKYDVPMDKQSSQQLRWDAMRKNNPMHMSSKIVVCGHTPQRNVFNNNHLICIDTGCGIWDSAKLTALDVSQNVIWQASKFSEEAITKQL